MRAIEIRAIVPSIQAPRRANISAGVSWGVMGLFGVCVQIRMGDARDVNCADLDFHVRPVKMHVLAC